jgi:hypothetical protein
MSPKKVIANTFSKNANIMEDLYSETERLSTELVELKRHIQNLNNTFLVSKPEKGRVQILFLIHLSKDRH